MVLLVQIYTLLLIQLVVAYWFITDSPMCLLISKFYIESTLDPLLGC